MAFFLAVICSWFFFINLFRKIFRLLNLLCYFAELCFFPRSYLFTDLLVLHQVTELVMHLNIPNYQNWNSSVLGHFFKISSLNEKYESIRLCFFCRFLSSNLLSFPNFAKILRILCLLNLSSQLFVHSQLFVEFCIKLLNLLCIWIYQIIKIEIQVFWVISSKFLV